MRPLLPILAGVAALFLAACSEQPPEVSKRLIIVGFDGMDPNLVSQWMEDGSLPNFSALAAQGGFRPLETSNPPQSPVAWSDFATGMHPGQHGIYDFLRRDPQTYQPAFSISRTVPPENVLDIFGMSLPLDSGEIINRRLGDPFWSKVESGGGYSTILRVPVTFPPDPIHRMFSGMGVPDLLGTQGTYTIFATQPLSAASTGSTRTVRIRPNREGHIVTALEGPAHPLKPEAPPLETTLVIDPSGDGARVELGDSIVELEEGQWSDWITVEFDFFGPASVSGIVRVLLVSSYPRLELYVSPIQIDPRAPVVPLTSPPDYAEQLAAEHGLFHTIGMPEETWSLNEGHIPDSAWLDMVRETLKEREMMFFDALERNDSDVITGVFVQTDRVSHMFYRGIDPQHPLFDETSEEARTAIHWIYQEADRILGRTMEQMGPNDRLMVISDHGFAPFRRAVHLNRWLVDNGLMVLNDEQDESGPGFTNIDWSKTRAYALGLNSIYLNRTGREANGIVSDSEADAIKRRIIAELPLAVDPKNDLQIVANVFDGDQLYPGNGNGDAPDLVAGYAPGFRASWQTTLGAVPGVLVEDNARKWSGDHCMTPEAVPGVLFTSFRDNQAIQSIADVADYVLETWQD
ncbi:MAG TPA: alkaline phosphatase family protein [Xanthomonadales bacterium]|nr:alkaline phosphatase family protein [Xanthomonadales bacterium]